jgi:hypothetical protein
MTEGMSLMIVLMMMMVIMMNHLMHTKIGFNNKAKILVYMMFVLHYPYVPITVLLTHIIVLVTVSISYIMNKSASA